jgi:hypothetical protein
VVAWRGGVLERQQPCGPVRQRPGGPAGQQAGSGDVRVVACLFFECAMNVNYRRRI